jgi:hypothetical protein
MALVMLVVLAVLLFGVHALTDRVVGGLHNASRKTSSSPARPTTTINGFPASSCAVVGHVTICRSQGSE